MTEQSDRLAQEREEIAARVARFKATQEKFERERAEYFIATLQNARLENPRHGLQRPARSSTQVRDLSFVIPANLRRREQ